MALLHLAPGCEILSQPGIFCFKTDVYPYMAPSSSRLPAGDNFPSPISSSAVCVFPFFGAYLLTKQKAPGIKDTGRFFHFYYPTASSSSEFTEELDELEEELDEEELDELEEDEFEELEDGLDDEDGELEEVTGGSSPPLPPCLPSQVVGMLLFL